MLGAEVRPLIAVPLDSSWTGAGGHRRGVEGWKDEEVKSHERR